MRRRLIYGARMIQIVNLQDLEDRKREIRAEIERLQAEFEEIEGAIRVASRFASPKLVKESPAEPKLESSTKLGPQRPSGIPTNFEMAQITIRDAVMRGKPGLTASEIVDEIAKRWWPGLQGPQILPIIYQLAKRGRLNKGEDGYFRLPDMNEAPASAGAPHSPSPRGDQTGTE